MVPGAEDMFWALGLGDQIIAPDLDPTRSPSARRELARRGRFTTKDIRGGHEALR
jgi:hypothetical protein